MVEKYGLPEGSRVMLNDSAYMDDDTWVAAVKYIAAGMQQMPVVRDHPGGFTFTMFDGFNTHVNNAESLVEWVRHKHRVVKEEAGTSHVNQAYDQQQAQADKRTSRDLLELCQRQMKGHINQWQLIAVLIVGIKSLPSKTWVNSFRNVNLHPKERVSFDAWCQRIHSHLETGETAYTRKMTICLTLCLLIGRT